MTRTFSEAARLHRFHCTGCSEYGNHGGEWNGVAGPGNAAFKPHDAGFDSPPPPSIEEQMQRAGRTISTMLEAYERNFGHVHTLECMDC